MTRFLIIAATLGPSATFVFGAHLSAARFHRREQRLKEQADGCLRAANQAETWGFKRGYEKGLEEGTDRGRLAGISTGINLRDQIDEIGDYSQ